MRAFPNFAVPPPIPNWNPMGRNASYYTTPWQLPDSAIRIQNYEFEAARVLSSSGSPYVGIAFSSIGSISLQENNNLLSPDGDASPAPWSDYDYGFWLPKTSISGQYGVRLARTLFWNGNPAFVGEGGFEGASSGAPIVPGKWYTPGVIRKFNTRRQQFEGVGTSTLIAVFELRWESTKEIFGRFKCTFQSHRIPG